MGPIPASPHISYEAQFRICKHFVHDRHPSISAPFPAWRKHEVRATLASRAKFNRCQSISVGEGNGNPLRCSCLENSMDRGAWWATYSSWGLEESDTTEQLTFSLNHRAYSKFTISPCHFSLLFQDPTLHLVLMSP